MRIRGRSWFMAAAIVAVLPALAADTPLGPGPHFEPSRVTLTDPVTGNALGTAANPIPTSPAAQSGSLTGQTTVSCAATTTTLLAAAAASNFVTIKNLNAAANTVWINFTGVAAVAAAPSFDLAPGSSITFASNTFLPTQQINCIASPGAQSVTLVYK